MEWLKHESITTSAERKDLMYVIFYHYSKDEILILIIIIIIPVFFFAVIGSFNMIKEKIKSKIITVAIWAGKCSLLKILSISYRDKV